MKSPFAGAVGLSGQSETPAGFSASHGRNAAATSSGNGCTASLRFLVHEACTVAVGESPSRLKFPGVMLANSETRKPVAHAVR